MKYPEVEIVEIADTIMYQNSIQMLLTRPPEEILYQTDAETINMIEIMKQYDQFDSLKYQNYRIQRNQYQDYPFFKNKFQKPRYIEFALSCLKQRVCSTDDFCNLRVFEVHQIKILDMRDYMEMDFTIAEQVNLIPDLIKQIKPATFCGNQLLKTSLVQPMFGLGQIQQRQNLILKLTSHNCIQELEVAIKGITQYDQSISDILCLCKKVDKIEDRLKTYINFFGFITALEKLLQLLVKKRIFQVATIDIEDIRQDLYNSNMADYIRRHVNMQRLNCNQLIDILSQVDGLELLDDKRNQYKQLEESLKRYEKEFPELGNIRDLKLVMAHSPNSYYDQQWCFQIPNARFINQQSLIESIIKQKDKILNVMKQGNNIQIFTNHLFHISCQLKRIRSIILQTQDNELNNMNYLIIQSPQWLLRALRVTSEIDLCLSVLKYYRQQKKRITFPDFNQNGIEIINGQCILEPNTIKLDINFVNISLVADCQNSLEKSLILIAQYVILAQNGFPVPCEKMSFRPFKSLGVYLKSYHQQNIRENQSSFQAEIYGLSRLLYENQYYGEKNYQSSNIISQINEQYPKLILIETLVNCSSPLTNNCMGQAMIEYQVTSTEPLTSVIGIKFGDLNISYFDQVYFYIYENNIFKDMDQYQILKHFTQISEDQEEDVQQFLHEFHNPDEIQEEFSEIVVQHLYSKMNL